MAAVSDLPLHSAFSLLQYALEKESDKYAWDMWLTKYPWMNKENYVSFNDFKEELLKPQIKHTNKSFDDIEKEMSEVVNAYERQVK